MSEWQATRVQLDRLNDDAVTREQRRALVREIQRFEHIDDEVARALLQVPRHAFVAPELRDRAYEDGPLPIGHGQTISQPTVVAMMTQALALTGTERVLEIGTGSGYQAAVLGQLSRRVDTIEVIGELAVRARALLRALGYHNVVVHVGDGYAGLPAHAPFDRIMITAAPPNVPRQLAEQLREGGLMIAPVGPFAGVQELVLYEKRERLVERAVLGSVRFVPMVAPEQPL